MSTYRDDLGEEPQVLRPFNFAGLDVLEIGMLAGATSRYLAKQANSLYLVEDSGEKYQKAKTELAGFSNWEGQVAKFASLKLDRKFDVVCVWGAFDFSELQFGNQELKNKSPFPQFLERLTSFLREDGVVVLATENRLGLPFWNATPEGYSNRLFEGVCGYPPSRTPKTFSKRETENFLKEAGFETLSVFYPFPEYRKASQVFTSPFIQRYPELASALASESHSTNQGRFFPDSLAMRSLGEAGLLEDLATSFLFVGTRELESRIFHRLLGETQDRERLAWCLESHEEIFSEWDGVLRIEKTNPETSTRNRRVLFDSKDSEVVSLRLELSRCAYFEDWERTILLLENYLSWLFARFKTDNPEMLATEALELSPERVFWIEETKEFRSFDPVHKSSGGLVRKSACVLRSLRRLDKFRDEIFSACPLRNLRSLYGALCDQLNIPPAFEHDLWIEAEREALEGKGEVSHQIIETRESLEGNFRRNTLTRSAEDELRMKREYPLLLKEYQAFMKGFLPRVWRVFHRKFEKALQKGNPVLERLEQWGNRGKALVAGLSHSFPQRWASVIEELGTDESGLREKQIFRLHPVLGHAPKFEWLAIHASFSERLEAGDEAELWLYAIGGKVPVLIPCAEKTRFFRVIRIEFPIERIELCLLTKSRSVRVTGVRVQNLNQILAAAALLLGRSWELITHPKSLSSLKSELLSDKRKSGWKLALVNSLRRETLNGPLAKAETHRTWCDKFSTLTAADRAGISAHVSSFLQRPRISIVLPVMNTPEKLLRECLDSVVNQIYPDWELCVADDGSDQGHVRRILQEYAVRDFRIKLAYRDARGHISAASNTALEMATGEFLTFLDHDDTLAEEALYFVALELNRHPEANLLYTDEDKIDESGRRYAPHFKPRWNRLLLYGYNFVTHLAVYRTERVRSLGGLRTECVGSQDYDLLLRYIETIPESSIHHIPFVLYHWRAIPGSVALHHLEKNYATDAARVALRQHFERTGIAAVIEEGKLPYLHRVRFALPDNLPKVSVIIATRDHVELLRQALEGILGKTDYPNLEVVVINNGSIKRETLDYLEGLQEKENVRVIEYDEPFNFSAINNLGAKAATGDYYLLLNNDIEVTDSQWLREMVSFFTLSEVAAVGAKLYFPNGSVQHAGVVLGPGGVAGHVQKGLHHDHPGYFGWLQLSRYASAVTAACLLVKKEVYWEVNALDSLHLPVAFNDVDFCLRLNRNGYRVAFAANAELIHHESATRGSDMNPENVARFRIESDLMKRRWGKILQEDPFYNPNLTVEREDFSTAFPPRVEKPWLAYLPVVAEVEVVREETSAEAADEDFIITLGLSENEPRPESLI